MKSTLIVVLAVLTFNAPYVDATDKGPSTVKRTPDSHPHEATTNRKTTRCRETYSG